MDLTNPQIIMRDKEIAQLRAENEKLAAVQDDLAALRLFAANLNATHNATLKEMQITMRQELAAAQADAARYRWLRENLDNTEALEELYEYPGDIPTAEELDAAIDKEMGK